MPHKKNADLFKDLRVVHEEPHYLLYAQSKPLMTPAGTSYRLPTAGLAEAVAEEWRAQGDKIVPSTMPMTQLAATALDIVGKDRERIVQQTLAYSSSELLCHRAEQPETLAARQDEVWEPLLTWCAGRFGALLRAGAGIMPIPQSPEAITALHAAIAAYDNFALAGLSHATDVTGSVVLGLAMAERELKAAAAFEAAELDAGFQALKWGVDPAMQARFESIRRDLENCERWFGLVK